MVGGVKPDGWDDMTFHKQIALVYEERFWVNLDDETKIQFINKIPNDTLLHHRLKSLNDYTNNSKTVKDAIANRMSSAGQVLAPEASHLLSPTSSPRYPPLPDFYTVSLNAHNADNAELSRHPSSHADASRKSFEEHPFKPHSQRE